MEINRGAYGTIHEDPENTEYIRKKPSTKLVNIMKINGGIHSSILKDNFVINNIKSDFIIPGIVSQTGELILRKGEMDCYNLMLMSNLSTRLNICEQMFLNILTAILNLNMCGIEHRDIKLDNIVIMKTGVYKLIDFGLIYINKTSADATSDTLMLCFAILKFTFRKYVTYDNVKALFTQYNNIKLPRVLIIIYSLIYKNYLNPYEILNNYFKFDLGNVMVNNIYLDGNVSVYKYAKYVAIANKFINPKCNSYVYAYVYQTLINKKIQTALNYYELIEGIVCLCTRMFSKFNQFMVNGLEIETKVLRLFNYQFPTKIIMGDLPKKVDSVSLLSFIL